MKHCSRCGIQLHNHLDIAVGQCAHCYFEVQGIHTPPNTVQIQAIHENLMLVDMDDPVWNLHKRGD